MRCTEILTRTDTVTATAHRRRPPDLQEVVPQLPLLPTFVLDALLRELNLVLELKAVIKHDAVRDLLIHHLLEERRHFSDDRCREAAERDRHSGDVVAGGELATKGVVMESGRVLKGLEAAMVVELICTLSAGG